MNPLHAFAQRLRYRGWSGYCPICEKGVRFNIVGPWYRDQLICASCLSIPRQRALIHVLETLYPDWRELAIHESSPGAGAASRKLRAQCPGYVASWFDHGERHQDLGRQTFPDEAFDLVITQDVFEHLFEPDLAIRDIARTLRPGGAHIMTVPIVRKGLPSRRRARMDGGEIVHIEPPDYHDSPEGPCLVTMDWGYDIAEFLAEHSGLPTTIFTPEERSLGIVAEYLDVVVSHQPTAVGSMARMVARTLSSRVASNGG